MKFIKPILKKYYLKEKTESILEKGKATVKSIPNPRKDWEASFQEMNKNGDDILLIDDIFEKELHEKAK